MTDAEKFAEAEHRLELLGSALTDVLVACGMVRADHGGMTGPELLCAAQDYCTAMEQEKKVHAGRLEVAESVKRDDGRWYVPVNRVNGAALGGIPGKTSDTVLRVASDAFDTQEGYAPLEAELFAHEVVGRWNAADPQQRTIKLGVIEFHSERFNPGLIDRFFAVRDDLTASGAIIDLWLMDIATVLRDYGYHLMITTERGAVVEGATHSTPADEADEWMRPEWSKATKIHDWRNHVDDDVQRIWDTFLPHQKKVLYDAAQSAAMAEEWD